MKTNTVIEALQRYNAATDPERLAMKYAAMRADPFVFFRGTCHLFYQRLPKLGTLADAPLAWSCGDLHLENFGSYKGDNRLVYFDLNDFDEAVLAPCIWDLIRVVASISVAGLSLKLKSQQTDRLCRLFIENYGVALAGGKARWIERDTAPGIIGKLLRTLKGKTRREQMAGRTKSSGKTVKLAIGNGHALKATKASIRFVEGVLAKHLEQCPKADRFRVLDVARRIAGTGSLGVERYVVLARMKRDDELVLFDLKLARPSSSNGWIATPQPVFTSEAERVVRVQSFVQAVAPSSLAVIVDEADAKATKSYVFRALQPSEDRLDLASLAQNADDLETVMSTMAGLLAWGQLRAAARLGAATPDALMEFASGSGWKERAVKVAAEAANRACKDWETYCEAFDAGAFKPAEVAKAA